LTMMMTCRLLCALLVLPCAAARPCARQRVVRFQLRTSPLLRLFSHRKQVFQGQQIRPRRQVQQSRPLRHREKMKGTIRKGFQVWKKLCQKLQLWWPLRQEVQVQQVRCLLQTRCLVGPVFQGVQVRWPIRHRKMVTTIRQSQKVAIIHLQTKQIRMPTIRPRRTRRLLSVLRQQRRRPRLLRQ
ncbi:hypothetical protein TcG_12549, partial [Trypanosoma cruzi]